MIIIKKLFYSFLFLIGLIVFSSLNIKQQITKKKYSGIERTLWLLNNSDEDHQNSLEILFYGQSIIGGMKTNILVDSLQKRFPYTNITFKHKPIGGFTIPDLVKTTPHDVYCENPDLIIFHAYGGIKDGLYDDLIRNIRSRMPSDILLLDHHYVWKTPESKLKSVNKSHDFDSESIKNIAKKYGCGYVNVREQWKAYLDKNEMTPNELMGNTVDPNVHPNDKGNKLLREIVLSKFPKTNKLNFYNVKNDSLRELIPLSKLSNDLQVNFSGGIVELLIDSKNFDKKAVFDVLIDGKNPSEYKSSYHIEKPSVGFKSWMPAISQVTLGKTFPREEKWEIKVFDIDRDNKKFKFSLEGSLTGFDGIGDSEEVFTSTSNRLEIDPKNFNIFRTERILKNKTPENFSIKFKVNQIAKDRVVIKPSENKHLLFSSLYSPNNTKRLKINLIEGNLDNCHIVISKPYILNFNNE